MRGVFVLLVIISIPLVLGVLSEEEYGTNLARIQTEAEIKWVRDNHYIIFNIPDHRNDYVRSLSDDDLAFLLRHEKVRENIGINEANLSGYLREIKIKEGLLENETLVKEEAVKESENLSEGKNEKPEVEMPSFCTKSRYDPFGIFSRISSELLGRLGTRYCLA